MAAVAIAFVFSLFFYLLLTAGTGSILLWSKAELVVAVLFSAVVAVVAGKIYKGLGIRPSAKLLNPLRWLLLLIYAIGPLFFQMAKANLEVAYRVITGNIKPGIVKISPGLKTGLARTVLANSITLTPGTLTIDVDRKGNFYVHWIYVRDKKPKPEEICGSFAKWARLIGG